MRQPCAGVILAGGAASRYGGLPKGLERVGGIRIVDRVAAALREVSDELWIIANTPDAAGWIPDARLGGDVVLNAGGLGGLHAALHHAQSAVLVVAWDMPFVPAGLLARLRELGDRADVAVPESDSRRGVEPLCAFYGAACLPVIEQRLALDDLRVVGFHDAVRVARLPAGEVAEFGDPAFLFMNVNAPEDLERAELHAASTHGGHRWTQERRQDDAGRAPGG
jgi:molybdopterin-guanine dinucleotide biosynthesis protein A